MGQVYDSIIIGAGLSGLLLAQNLRKNQESFWVLEKENAVGGSHRPAEWVTGDPLDRGFPFYERTEFNLSILDWLKVSFPWIRYSVQENRIAHYTEQKWQVFQGFHANDVLFLKEIQHFLSPEKIELHFNWYDLINELANDLGDRVCLETFVEKIQVLPNQEIQLHLSNGKKMIAHKVYFTGNFSELLPLLPPDMITGRLLQHIKHPKLASALIVSHAYRDLSDLTDLDTTQLYLLNLGTVEQMLPCFGCMKKVSKTENGYHQVQWMTFIDNKDIDDPEVVGELIKKLRKVVKKAFPNWPADPLLERIEVLPYRLGRIESNQVHTFQLKGLPQFWMLCPQFSPKSVSLSFIEPAYTAVTQRVPELSFPPVDVST